MDNPILSICIPTYNRAIYLEDTLNSIISQNRFQETNEVEIVISDNCSEDNTREISEKFVRIYGDKIRYYRNSENIKDSNFEKVLSYGSGIFLKLNNDTLKHNKNTLDIILDAIYQNLANKDIIFFSNGMLKNIAQIHCKDLNSFVKNVSYWSTWIACFGIWKEDFDTFDGFSRNSGLQLVQTDVLLRLINSGKLVYINNKNIFDSIPPVNKGGYNIYKVFVSNYFQLLDEYKKTNKISKITYFNEKSKLLIYFLIPWTIDLMINKTIYSFDKKGAISIVFSKYKYHPLLYIALIYLFIKIINIKINRFIKAKA